jgi:Cu2+-containing amine oxidase
VRPKITLIVRMAASVGNYDYIVDWEFQTDGLIRVKVLLINTINSKKKLKYISAIDFDTTIQN